MVVRIANREDPDQSASHKQSDLGLHSLFCFWFYLILYVPVNNFSVISGWVFLG